METDISNKTIVVLVVLTVVISVLSTLLMMNEVNNNVKVAPKTSSSAQQTTHSTQGKVSLTVLPDKPAMSTTGHVTLNILK
jgi:hypothetical protein